MLRRFSFLLFLSLLCTCVRAQEKWPVIIDADTANEVDDLYAIVCGLIEPSWEVKGLTAAQWQISHWRNIPNSMEEGHRLNQMLVGYLGLNGKITTRRGAVARLFDWGHKAQTSPASELIATEAESLLAGKLNVVALGALTNVATVLLDHPELATKLRIFWLGSSFDFERQLMRNVDFNSMMDIQALDVVLNSPVELSIIPNNVARKMEVDFAETHQRLAGTSRVADLLLRRWEEHADGIRDQRV
ncbi:MAG: nucleoside hydrolase, partial [Bacteroidota bacterium]